MTFIANNVVWQALQTGPSGLLHFMESTPSTTIDCFLAADAQTCFGPLSEILQNRRVGTTNLFNGFLAFKRKINRAPRQIGGIQSGMTRIAKGLAKIDPKHYRDSIQELSQVQSGRVCIFVKPTAVRVIEGHVWNHHEYNVSLYALKLVDQYCQKPSTWMIATLVEMVKKDQTAAMDALVMLSEKYEEARDAVERLWEDRAEAFNHHHWGAIFYLMIIHHYFEKLCEGLVLENPAMSLSAEIYCLKVMPRPGEPLFKKIPQMLRHVTADHVHALVAMGNLNVWAIKILLYLQSRSLPNREARELLEKYSRGQAG